MAKDAKGHGSEKRGASGGKPEFNASPGKSDLALMGRYLRGGLSASESAQLGDAHAAATLAAGHPKSGVAPVHSGATGRIDNIDRNLRGPGKHVGYGGSDTYHIQKSNGAKSNWYSAVGQRTGHVVSGKGLREVSGKLK